MWIVTNARRSEPYENVAPKAGRLRKSLLPIALTVLGAAFLASLPFLPYDYVRSGTLGSPEITVEVVGRQWAGRSTRGRSRWACRWSSSSEQPTSTTASASTTPTEG
ncbi:hypothetical protein MPNT_410010 [Candidatus Methylacidithermus pantelleriae]|uniref:Uncharacterized protein n=1 Tax=Candidatus Methylacidithermus pantelleriae TaxID=2744239 RepID=A0A8J2FSY9_9BACT|nr:hypothetical protein MPNT_410010 [Candidatus Methylacidithermus pantelleriae]